MPRGVRLFVGQKLRQLRLDQRLDQSAMSRLLGISVSYLSQLENDDRPLTASVKAALARAFPLDWSSFDERQEEQLLGAFNWAMASAPVGSRPVEAERAERLLLQYPEFAAHYVDLHRAWRQAQDHIAMMEEAIGSDASPNARTPWELVRDWFHTAGNYVHALDCRAEDLAEMLAIGSGDAEHRLTLALEQRHGCETQMVEEPGDFQRSFDPHQRLTRINAAQPAETRVFQLAALLMRLEAQDIVQTVVADAKLGQRDADALLQLGLANYGAGALLMPYRRFRDTARALRHDIDRLARAFGVSFEQACHRLSTLQRPGTRGIPFFFCRIDMAGNITKRHSATRLQFARFGGACPLWVVHEAVAIPDRIQVQLGETPDGVRYVSMARGLVKPSGSYARAPRRYAVALGCEIEHAANFIYADGLRLHDEAAAAPIGTSCRLCPREGCDQRAFPPLGRAIHINPDDRHVVPYRIG